MFLLCTLSLTLINTVIDKINSVGLHCLASLSAIGCKVFPGSQGGYPMSNQKRSRDLRRHWHHASHFYFWTKLHACLVFFFRFLCYWIVCSCLVIRGCLLRVCICLKRVNRLYGFVVITRSLLLVFIHLSLRCVNRLFYSVVCCMIFSLFLEGFNFGFSSFWGVWIVCCTVLLVVRDFLVVSVCVKLSQIL